MNCSGIYFWISTKYENYNRLLKKCFIIWLSGTMAWNLLPQQEVKKELWKHRVRMTWNIFNRHFPYYITCGSSTRNRRWTLGLVLNKLKRYLKQIYTYFLTSWDVMFMDPSCLFPVWGVILIQWSHRRKCPLPVDTEMKLPVYQHLRTLKKAIGVSGLFEWLIVNMDIVGVKVCKVCFNSIWDSFLNISRFYIFVWNVWWEAVSNRRRVIKPHR